MAETQGGKGGGGAGWCCAGRRAVGCAGAGVARSCGWVAFTVQRAAGGCALGPPVRRLIETLGTPEAPLHVYPLPGRGTSPFAGLRSAPGYGFGVRRRGAGAGLLPGGDLLFHVALPVLQLRHPPLEQAQLLLHNLEVLSRNQIHLAEDLLDHFP